MARIPRYITRNRHGTLYFRVAVPRDLRPFFPSSEIQRSLHTNCLRQAATAGMPDGKTPTQFHLQLQPGYRGLDYLNAFA